MVSIASDHGGYRLKEHIKAYLTAKGISVLDCGCDSLDSCDYPIFGKAAAQAVADGRCEKGIVICTTGIGISICANKVKGIRCGLCSDPLSAELTRKHNNANMLAMGAGIIGPNMAERIVDVFLSTEFEGGRHARRVGLMMDIEKEVKGKKSCRPRSPGFFYVGEIAIAGELGPVVGDGKLLGAAVLKGAGAGSLDGGDLRGDIQTSGIRWSASRRQQPGRWRKWHHPRSRCR